MVDTGTSAASVPSPPARPGGAAPRGGGRRFAGVASLQALNALSTMVQLTAFAVVLTPGGFDHYAVWVTAGMFLVGLAQAVGVDRVVIGARGREEGRSAVGLLGLLVAGVGALTGVLLAEPALVAASVGLWFVVVWDHQRFVRCFEDPTYFLRRDLALLGVQVASLGAAFLLGGSGLWLALAWWGPTAVLLAGYLVLLDRGTPAAGWRAGAVALWRDRRECAPLLLDASLAGVPLVGALALAGAQGAPGDAAEARMAMTIMGPVTVLAMAGRRMVYARLAAGRLSAAFQLRWLGLSIAVLLACSALLSLTRTPLYSWVFSGFVGLGWLAVLGFAANHATLFASLVPSGELKRDLLARFVGVARIAATATAAAVAVLLMPVDSPGDVAWIMASGSVVNLAVLHAARLLTSRRVDRTAAQPLEDSN